MNNQTKTGVGDQTMKKSGEEEKVKQILTDAKLSAIKTMLEKDHAIDCLLLLYVNAANGKTPKISCEKTT